MVKIAHFLPRIKADRYWPEEDDDFIVFGNFIFPSLWKVRFCSEYIIDNSTQLKFRSCDRTFKQTEITTLHIQETNIHTVGSINCGIG